MAFQQLVARRAEHQDRRVLGGIGQVIQELEEGLLGRVDVVDDHHDRPIAADRGYASQDNLTAAKACGVTDVAFHKKRGLAVEDMVKSRWVYRKLRNFRAGIEAGISCLKRAYGLARCTWRGLDHFKTYIWSAVVAHNLVLLARLKPA